MIKNFILLTFLLYNYSAYAQTRGIQLIPQTDARYTLITPRETIPLVISVPGNYRFKNGATVDYTSSGTILKITSSDVSIDLQHFTLSQKNADHSPLEISGIEIAEGLANVSINNGKINNITGTGITIGQNCVNINIHNMYIIESKKIALTVNTNCNNIVIDNCLIARLNFANETTVGMRLITSKNVTISHSSIVNIIGQTGYSAYGLFATDCNNCSLVDSVVSGVTGKHALGIALNTCIDWIIENNESNNHTAIDGSATGLYMVKSIANKITNLEASNNKGTMNGYGLQIKINSNYNRFSKCTASNNYSSGSGSGYGFLINKGNSNYFGHVSAFANRGGSDSACEGTGIKLEKAKGNLIECSTFSDNNGETGTGYGIYLEDSEKCIIEENKLYYNQGSAGSWGIHEKGTPSSFIAANIAFGNQNNFGLKIESTLNAIQNIFFDAPRSVQRSHRGNVNIIGN